MDKKIVFYQDMYDHDFVVWQANKPYKIINEENNLYKCECEIANRDTGYFNEIQANSITNEYSFIEQSANKTSNIFFIL